MEKYGKFLAKPWKNMEKYGKTLAKPWKNMGKSTLNGCTVNDV
jgi:hypothetical protein